MAAAVAMGFAVPGGAKLKVVPVEERVRRPKGLDLSGVVLAMRVDGSSISSAVLVCEGPCRDWRRHDARAGGALWECAHCGAARRWG
jgi:hypothetical protein